MRPGDRAAEAFRATLKWDRIEGDAGVFGAGRVKICLLSSSCDRLTRSPISNPSCNSAMRGISAGSCSSPGSARPRPRSWPVRSGILAALGPPISLAPPMAVC